MTDQEKLDILKQFLRRVNGYGYLELSHDKIRGEYNYFHKKAGDLLQQLFYAEESSQIELKELNNDF